MMKTISKMLDELTGKMLDDLPPPEIAREDLPLKLSV